MKSLEKFESYALTQSEANQLFGGSRKYDHGPSRKYDHGPSRKFDHGPSRKFDIEQATISFE